MNGKNVKLLIIAAHPDDIELSMGGTICKYTNANVEVICYHTTNGVYTDIYNNPVRNFDEILDTTHRSLGLLGVKNENIFFNEDSNATELHINKKVISQIQKIILERGITEIFTHMEKDTYHQDHMQTHLIAMAASHRYINNIYCFESIFNFADGLMIPNTYIDISDSIDRKCESLRLHKTEYEKFKGEAWIESVRSLANYRGIQIGVKYAESFDVLKSVRAI